MTTIFTILHIVVSVVLILVVLAQQGKGQDLASAFGGGGSSAAFGARGTATLLSKITTGAAILFMVTSLGLSYFQPVMAGRTVVPDDEPGVETPAETVGETPTEPSADSETPPPTTDEESPDADAPTTEEEPKTEEKPVEDPGSTPQNNLL